MRFFVAVCEKAMDIFLDRREHLTTQDVTATRLREELRPLLEVENENLRNIVREVGAPS